MLYAEYGKRTGYHSPAFRSTGVNHVKGLTDVKQVTVRFAHVDGDQGGFARASGAAHQEKAAA